MTDHVDLEKTPHLCTCVHLHNPLVPEAHGIHLYLAVRYHCRVYEQMPF